MGSDAARDRIHLFDVRSSSQRDYERFCEFYHSIGREHEPAYFGWLCTRIPGYPDTLFLKTSVHLRSTPTRPFIEVQPTDHPLGVEQRDGITLERVREIYEKLTHEKD